MSETNRVVVRFLDGRVLKGTTEDFFPNRPSFHLRPIGAAGVQDIRCKDLKAVFFVKDFEGNAERKDIQGFDQAPPDASRGKKIAVRFKDGELICGFTLAYTPDRAGFFMLPADPGSNNMRIYVLMHAAREVRVGPQADALAQKSGNQKAA
jgi:hypothetical protein